MKATFYGRTEGSHTGFVRIKTGQISANKEEIILPFDVDVSGGNAHSIPYNSAKLFSLFLELCRIFFRGINSLSNVCTR